MVSWTDGQVDGGLARTSSLVKARLRFGKVKNRTLEGHKGAAPGEEGKKQVPRSARDDRFCGDELGRRHWIGDKRREKSKTAPLKSRGAAPGGRDRTAPLKTHKDAVLGLGWALGQTDTIGPVFTYERAALAIFDGYWAFFVARVPGVCFGLCAAGSRIGNIVTFGSLCAWSSGK
jgi:hypothetical protein